MCGHEKGKKDEATGGGQIKKKSRKRGRNRNYLPRSLLYIFNSQLISQILIGRLPSITKTSKKSKQTEKLKLVTHSYLLTSRLLC